MLGRDHPEKRQRATTTLPLEQFPLLVDGDRSLAESTCIIEHLHEHHPGPNRWIPDGELGRRVRFLDPVFDLRRMANMQAVVFDAIQPAEDRNPAERSIGRERLRTAWATDEQFTLADCAAAPSLFFAEWGGGDRRSPSQAESLSCPTAGVPGGRPGRR